MSLVKQEVNIRNVKQIQFFSSTASVARSLGETKNGPFLPQTYFYSLLHDNLFNQKYMSKNEKIY